MQHSSSIWKRTVSPSWNFFKFAQKYIRLARFYFGKNHKLFVRLFFSKKILKNGFVFFDISFSQFSLHFPVQQSFQLFWKVYTALTFFLRCIASHVTHRSGCNNSEQVFSPFQTRLVFLFLKFLMCSRFRLGPCSSWMHRGQKYDAIVT